VREKKLKVKNFFFKNLLKFPSTLIALNNDAASSKVKTNFNSLKTTLNLTATSSALLTLQLSVAVV
jgi:hypothetical protein